MAIEENEPRLWTVTELATAAGVTTGLIRQYLIRGKLKGRKLANTWLISDPEARRFLATRKRDKPPDPGG